MIPGYELTGELNKEGSYRLHRGVRRADAKSVLIKTPHHQPARRADLMALEREYTVLNALPNEITRVISLLRQDGHCALVFEDTGGVLLNALCASKPLDIAASLAVTGQIATALAELHRRDITMATSGLKPFWSIQKASGHG